MPRHFERRETIALCCLGYLPGEALVLVVALDDDCILRSSIQIDGMTVSAYLRDRTARQLDQEVDCFDCFLEYMGSMGRYGQHKSSSGRKQQLELIIAIEIAGGERFAISVGAIIISKMTTRKPRMLCIGTATQDVFLTSKAFKPHREDDGEYYEEFLLGAKLAVDDVTFATGGNAMNAAVTFARQGLESEFMGILGIEPAGQIVMHALDNEGIATHYLVQDERFQTSYSTILLAPNGERTILNYHGTKLSGSGTLLDLGAVEHADWLYLSSVGSMSLLEKLVSRAAKAGVQVALNPSGAELAEADKLRTVLDDVAILLVNKEEMRQIVEGTTLEELVRHGSNLVRTVVVSDGPRGVMATDSTKIVKAGTYEDVPVVDRTGAGDAFGSGFVAWYAAGKSLEDAITFASANATSVVTEVGATSGILHAHSHIHDMPLTVKDF